MQLVAYIRHLPRQYTFPGPIRVVSLRAEPQSGATFIILYFLGTALCGLNRKSPGELPNCTLNKLLEAVGAMKPLP